MGIYLVIEANNGLILMWDRKTSLFIKLSPKYKVTLQFVNEDFGFIVTAIVALRRKKTSFVSMFKVEQHDIRGSTISGSCVWAVWQLRRQCK